jgi:hypothetical protein
MPSRGSKGTVCAALVGFGLGLPAAPASATFLLVNNGSAPPDPANVIEAGESTQADQLGVRNVGCTGTGPCASPGASTAVRIESGAQLGSAECFDTSQLELADGQLGTNPVSQSLLTARDAASVTMSGGTVAGAAGSLGSASFTLSGGTLGAVLFAENQSQLTMSGGEVAMGQVFDAARLRIVGGRVRGGLQAFGDGRIRVEGGLLDTAGNDEEILAFANSVITVVGDAFAVNASPVGYGPIAATSGQLTGSLASGDPIDIAFRHAGATAGLTGQIVLSAPSAAPVPALGALPQVALAALLAALAFGAVSRSRSGRG